MTLYDDSNNVGCSLVGSNGYAHFETWPSRYEYFSIFMGDAPPRNSEQFLTHSLFFFFIAFALIVM